MKRSEMLNIIWESINELEDANNILTRIENTGMLPPITYAPYCIGRDRNGKPVAFDINRFGAHVWDLEDEELESYKERKQ